MLTFAPEFTTYYFQVSLLHTESVPSWQEINLLDLNLLGLKLSLPKR